MFTGVLTALITPFKDGALDKQALAEMTEWQIAAGIDGLVPCGTTGEAATLSPAERLEVVRVVADVAKGRVPIVAGTGTNATQGSIELSKAAVEAGADGVLLVCPYYNKPTQGGLVAHVEAILAEVDVPAILYNIPGRTGVDMQVETFARLSEHERVVGIKEASGQVTRSADLVRAVGDRAVVLAGDDPLYLPILAVGGGGIISASAGVAPEAMVSLYRDFNAGDLEGARATFFELLDLFSALFCETNPGPAKVALHLMGKIAPEIRLPLVWPGQSSVDTVRSALVKAGLLEGA